MSEKQQQPETCIMIKVHSVATWFQFAGLFCHYFISDLRTAVSILKF